ncbi:rhomboid protein 1 [Hanseniaspora vineae]
MFPTRTRLFNAKSVTLAKSTVAKGHNFTKDHGKLFFLSNAVHLQNKQPLRLSKPLMSSVMGIPVMKVVQRFGLHGKHYFKQTFQHYGANTNQRGLTLFKKLLSPATFSTKRSVFSGSNFSRLNRFGNPSYYSRGGNNNSVKNITIFGLIFMGVTFFATPYLFQYVPGFTYFQKNPQAMVWSIIGINALVFALWQFPRNWYFLRRYFLLEKDAIFSKWSLIGSAFSHQEIWHIGANMLCLWSFGFGLANMLGSAGFFSLYMNSLMLSSLFSLWYPRIMRLMIRGPSLGASGALFGVFGTFAYLFPHAKIMLFVFPIPGGAWVAFLGGALWNLAGCVFRWGTFDYAAHLGGSLMGLAYGYYFQEIIRKKRAQQPKRITSLRDLF